MDELEKNLKLFTYFHSFDEKTMKDAVEISKLLIFNKDDTILGDGCGFLNYVYFIVSGKCQMIEQIFLSHKIIGNKIIYRPGLQVSSKTINKENVKKVHFQETATRKSSKSKLTIRNTFKTEKEFVQVCLFSEGGCFGLGENLENRRIIAAEKTKCILLPRYWLWNKGAANIWARTKIYLQMKIPSSERVIQEIIAEKKWQQYKVAYVNSIIDKKKAFVGTNIYDVPLSILIKENLIFVK